MQIQNSGNGKSLPVGTEVCRTSMQEHLIERNEDEDKKHFGNCLNI
jgi:hypothetical protein